MSCDQIDGNRRCCSTDCCGNNCTLDKSGCEAHVSSCNCQNNVGCPDRDACGGLRPTGTAATGACPGPCQCVEEEIWNSNVPPKPDCRWLNNFTELRRQWSDHGRQRTYKCRGCTRPCRTVTSCRPCLSPTPPCPGTVLLTSDCQKCCGSRRLAGGASKSKMVPADKSSSPEPLKREAGGGCPPPSCSHSSTRYTCNSPNADYSSTVSSCCSSQCKYPQAASYRASDRPCTLKSILKRRSYLQYNTSRCCLCQPMSRNCNCPPPIQVDARAADECSCDCPSRPKCACPPSERRFPKATVKCPNARLCCPTPRLPSPKCHCQPCQPCPPPSCGTCTSFKCRRSVSAKDPCPPGSPRSSCQPSSRPTSTTSPCRPSTPCRKLTFCTEHSSRSSSSCTGQSWNGIIGDKSSESSICSEQSDDERRRIRDKKDHDRCYPMDCAGSEHADKSRDLTLNGESLQNSTSKTLTNLSKTTNPSKSVDPESRGERNETAFESGADTLEACITEKSSKDSWYTSLTRAPTSSGAKTAKPDCYAFHEEYPAAGGNVSGNSILARLSSRMRSFSRVKDLSAPNKTPRHGVTFRDASRTRVELLADDASISIPTTTPTRGIDRRRGNGGSLREGISCTSKGTSRVYAQPNERKSASACYDLFSNLGDIGYSALIPCPLALIAFALLILVAVTWSSCSAFYRRYLLRKRICWKYRCL